MSGCSDGQVNFFVLDTIDSWTKYKHKGTVAISGDGISLPSMTGYAMAQNPPVPPLPAGLQVQAMAAGRCGVLYLLDSNSHAVWTFDSNLPLFAHAPTIQRRTKSSAALAQQGGMLFVADTGKVRLCALALLNGQIRWTAGGDVASADGTVKVAGFTPAALATAPNQHLYALDSGNSAVLHFDERGQLVDSLDVGLEGTELTALARARDGTLYVLTAAGGVVQRLPLGSFKNFPIPEVTNAASITVDSYGTVYIGESSSSASAVSPIESRVIWTYNQSGASLGSLPAFTGPADKLAMDCADSLYAYTNAYSSAGVHQPAALFLLKPQVSYLMQTTASASADYHSRHFDSGSTGTRWHRLAIAADLPANTNFQVSYRASDSLTSPGQWSTPPLLNAGDALLMQATGQYLWLKFTLTGTASATPDVHSVCIYFPRVSYLRYLPAIYSQDPKSRDFLERFLSIFETIFSGIETTTTNMVRYFDPRVVTGDFLRWLAQWLAIAVDNTWTDAQLRTLLLEAPDLFRERGTPAGIAEVIRIYLGVAPIIIEQSQLACTQDSDLIKLYTRLYCGGPFSFCVLVPPYLQVGAAAQGDTRQFPDPGAAVIPTGGSVTLTLGSRSYNIPLPDAVSLQGLRDAINALSVGAVAIIRRHHSAASITYYLRIWARRIGPRTLDLEDHSGNTLLASSKPGAYTLVSPWTDESRAALQRIVDQEKPAHTRGSIQILQPRILLDMHSYLEVNTWLVKPSPMLDTGACMPLDAMVEDATPIGQDGVRSRLELDTVLG